MVRAYMLPCVCMTPSLSTPQIAYHRVLDRESEGLLPGADADAAAPLIQGTAVIAGRIVHGAPTQTALNVVACDSQLGLLTHGERGRPLVAFTLCCWRPVAAACYTSVQGFKALSERKGNIGATAVHGLWAGGNIGAMIRRPLNNAWDDAYVHACKRLRDHQIILATSCHSLLVTFDPINVTWTDRKSVV